MPAASPPRPPKSDPGGKGETFLDFADNLAKRSARFLIHLKSQRVRAGRDGRIMRDDYHARARILIQIKGFARRSLFIA